MPPTCGALKPVVVWHCALRPCEGGAQHVKTIPNILGCSPPSRIGVARSASTNRGISCGLAEPSAPDHRDGVTCRCEESVRKRLPLLLYACITPARPWPQVAEDPRHRPRSGRHPG